MSKPEILFLSHRIPYPPDKGDKIRSWQWLKHFSDRFRVHLACFVDDPRDFAHTDFLSDICETAAFIPLNPKLARLKSGIALFHGTPLSFRYFHSSKMETAVRTARARPLVMEFAFSSAMAPFIAAPIAGRKRFVDFCDADSEKWLQYAEHAAPPLRQLYSREGRLLKRAETQIANWADGSFAISDDESAMFNSRSEITKPVSSLPNGVDAEYFSRDAAPSDCPENDIAFVGAMDYRANVEGVLHFTQHVWPLVRKKKQDATFAIVGSNPASSISELNGKDGITVTGRVEDVRPWLAGAKIAIAPLRVARGVQNKVLEAMSMSMPVVATPEAITGIHPPTDAARVSKTSDDKANVILTLLEDETSRRSMGDAARRFVVNQFSWQSALHQLDGILNSAGVQSSSPSSSKTSSAISMTR